MIGLRSGVGARTPGRFGRWSHKSHFAGIGRREMPRALVLRLWDEGMTAPQIVDRIGPVRGIKFSSASIGRVILDARRDGYVRYHRDPARNLGDDVGRISPARASALGL